MGFDGTNVFDLNNALTSDIEFIQEILPDANQHMCDMFVYFIERYIKISGDRQFLHC